MILLYQLVYKNEVMYIGLTHYKQMKKRRSAHKNNKPPHEFMVVGMYETIEDARVAEIQSIKEHQTYDSYTKWNKSPGGEYDTPGYTRRGVGGRKKGSIPWNKGLTKSDIRVKNNIDNAAKTRKANGFYDKCSIYLPKLYGNENPMRNPEVALKFSQKITGRKLVREPSGNYWLYPDGSRSKSKS